MDACAGAHVRSRYSFFLFIFFFREEICCAGANDFTVDNRGDVGSWVSFLFLFSLNFCSTLLWNLYVVSKSYIYFFALCVCLRRYEKQLCLR